MEYQFLFKNVLSCDNSFADTISIGENGAKAFRCSPSRKVDKLWEIFGEKKKDHKNLPRHLTIFAKDLRKDGLRN